MFAQLISSRAFRMAGLASAAGLLIGLLCPVWALAQGARPQPRVVYSMHSAGIEQIRATPDFARVVTIGHDKTVRVWRALDLKMIRAIPLPSDEGDEGDPRSLAIVGNGSEVIVGGYTGLTWKKQSQLYRIDLETGRMVETIRGFDGSIESLAVSRDGRLLAVGLGRAGATVIDLQSKQKVFSDGEYGERVMFTDFAPDGRLATTSADGCMRVYDPTGKILFRADWPPQQDASKACKGAAPLGGIRFSPDGKYLAFGVTDRPEVVLMDGHTLQMRKVIKVGENNQKSLCCIAWTPDSSQLYINGVHLASGPTPLYRVADSGIGAVDTLPVGRDLYTNMLPLPNGDVIFSTDSPSLVRIRGGQRVAEALPPNINFRFDWQQFRLSADGSRMVVPTQANNSKLQFFEHGAAPDRAYRAAQNDDVANTRAPLRSGQVEVETETGIFGYKQPTRVNGNQVSLRPFQSVWSWANHATKPVAAIGTVWSVLLTDAQAKILWQKMMPAPAYQTTISADGRWVVVGIGDGTVRWLGVDDGKEALGLFMHNNGRDWVAWRPDGYYASSLNGDEYIGWLVNRGDEQTPDLLRAVQFERTLYRPDLVATALLPGTTRSLAPVSDLGRVLTESAAPRVTVERLESNQNGTVSVQFKVEPAGRPVRELGVYANGIPVLTSAARHVRGEEATRPIVRTVQIPSYIPVDNIRVEAETEASIGIDETLPLASQAAKGHGRGKLRVLAIGVKDFEDAQRCAQNGTCRVKVSALPNAPADAHQIAQSFMSQAQQLYESIQVTVLSDQTAEKPTKANIVAKLRELDSADPEDTTVIFLASHGFASGALATDYYFLPRDGRMNELASLFPSNPSSSAGNKAALPSLLSATELSTALRRVAGKRLLFIDTCHSAAADGRNNQFSLAKRSAASRIGILSASSGEEESYEATDAPHGAFTYSLIQALSGRADANRDGMVSLQETHAFIVPQVAANMRRLNEEQRKKDPAHVDKNQTPVLEAIPALSETALGRIASDANKP